MRKRKKELKENRSESSTLKTNNNRRIWYRGMREREVEQCDIMTVWLILKK
jgi:hypothetical protein